MSEPLVSVIVPTYNAAGSIQACLGGIADQSYANIEILVCDDASTDETLALASTIDDSRVRILRSDVNSGSAAVRNRGVRQAAGEIIFFTDDDVEVDHDWIRNCLPFFENPAIVGVEGKIIYVAADYRPRYSDRVVQNLHGGEYMTANMAYRKTALEQVGLFNETLRHYADGELGRRIKKLGQIAFAENVVVCHIRDRYTVKSFMHEATKVGLFLDLPDRESRPGPIIHPGHLITLLLPPLVLIKLLRHPRPDRRDMLMLLLYYPRLVFERYVIWRWALRNKTLAI